MSSQPTSYVTPEEYLKFERQAETKHEYLHGEVVAMPGGTPQHSLIAANIILALGAGARNRGCLAFTSDTRVCVNWGKLITYPDVTAVCGPPQYTDDKADTITNPTFIAEVLSPSTKNYDRGEKARLYWMLPSLSEFILVEQVPTNVEHWRRLPNANWEVSIIRDRRSVLHLESMNCDLSIDAVYQGIELLSPTQHTD